MTVRRNIHCLRERQISDMSQAANRVATGHRAIPGAGAAVALLLVGLAACSVAPVGGYPSDPEDTTATLKALQPYFDTQMDKDYSKYPMGDSRRQQLRDEVVLSRIRAYDIEFEDFEKRLNGDANVVTAGGDLLVLVLNGLGATTGAASTKAALAAASAGIVGAKAVIDKDLYFQKTLPALLAQMEANRTKVKLSILTGLNDDDSKYPLVRAELDLDALKRASGIPASIQNITQEAVDQKAKSQTQIDELRNLSASHSTSTQRLSTWLHPNGPKTTDPANFEKLNAWIKGRFPPPNDLPVASFVGGDGPGLESARQSAIMDLGILPPPISLTAQPPRKSDIPQAPPANTLPSTQRLKVWIWPNGQPDENHMALLRDWLARQPDERLSKTTAPVFVADTSPELERERQKAIFDLNIP